MKKLILSTTVAAFAAMTIQAQEIPERKKEESKPILKEKIINKKQRENLNLTDEQKEKLKTMNQDLRQQMEDMRKQDNLTVKEYREKMETLRKDRQAKFQSILTDEQKAQMKNYKEALDARKKEFGKRKEAKMKENLKLSDDQLAKMKDNREAVMEKVKTIKENKSLTDEQKKDEIKGIMKQQKEKMKSLLTDEQLQKMKENRKQHLKKKEVI